jgi:hypothetical protein
MPPSNPEPQDRDAQRHELAERIGYLFAKEWLRRCAGTRGNPGAKAPAVAPEDTDAKGRRQVPPR